MVDESNPVISRFTNKIKELINNKADKTNATQSNAGLMSAEDKVKLDEMSIQIIDEKISNEINGKEVTSNKVTSVSASSTDTQYPSAKCVYDLIGDINDYITS